MKWLCVDYCVPKRRDGLVPCPICCGFIEPSRLPARPTDSDVPMSASAAVS